MSEDLEITSDVVIAGEKLEWRFTPSGGPGGQHRNRSATRAELVVDLRSAVPPEVFEVLAEGLGSRMREGVVSVSVDETRSQARNRRIARRRLAALLAEALERPEPRRATKPTRASRERRLAAKRKRSETKRLRQEPPAD